MTELRQRLANLTGNSLFAQAIRIGAEIDLPGTVDMIRSQYNDNPELVTEIVGKDTIEMINEDLEAMSKKLHEALANMTQEDIDKYFPPDTRPKGWLRIEEHLPMMYAIDIMQGYTLYKVKDKDGNEFESGVSDHNVWYYMAKEAGITHWWNG